MTAINCTVPNTVRTTTTADKTVVISDRRSTRTERRFESTGFTAAAIAVTATNKPEDRAMFRHDFVEFIKTENIL